MNTSVFLLSNVPLPAKALGALVFFIKKIIA